MATDENILVVGADGSIGCALAERLKEQGFSVSKTTRRQPAVDSACSFLDLSDPKSWSLPPASTAFILAAETSTNLCRHQPELTQSINVDRTVALAEKLVAQGTRVVFLSTNLVFDGSIPYRKAEDATCPRTEYGRQKAEAEGRLKLLDEMVTIVRLTKVLNADHDLLKKWRAALTENQAIQPFSDMVVSPVPLSFVIDVLSLLAQNSVDGVLQISGPDDITYETIARNLAKQIGADQKLVQPTTSRAAGVDVEALPAYSTLDTSNLSKISGLALPAARSFLVG